MTPAQRVANVLFRLGAMTLPFRPGNFGANMAAMRRRTAEGLANPSGLPSKYADAAVCVLAYSVAGMEYPFPAVPSTVEMVGAVIRPDPPGTSVPHTDNPDVTDIFWCGPWSTITTPLPRPGRTASRLPSVSSRSGMTGAFRQSFIFTGTTVRKWVSKPRASPFGHARGSPLGRYVPVTRPAKPFT
jgi:hypothetical protein